MERKKASVTLRNRVDILGHVKMTSHSKICPRLKNVPSKDTYILILGIYLSPYMTKGLYGWDWVKGLVVGRKISRALHAIPPS